MYLLYSLFALLFSSPALVAGANSTSTLYTSATFCKTSYGDVQLANVPTSTTVYAENTTITVTFTSTPVAIGAVTSTVTVAISTIVVTATVTSPASSDLVSSTYTVVNAVTSPLYTYTEVYLTATSYFTGRLTLLNVPQFTPVLDTLPGALNVQKRSLRQKGPNVGLGHQLKLRQSFSNSTSQTSAQADASSTSSTSSVTFPKQVECAVISKTAAVVIESATAPTSTSFRYEEITEQATVVLTSTSTQYTPTPTQIITYTSTASNTITIYTPPESTQTFQYYGTDTVTVLYSLQQVYSQCATDNAAYFVSGRNIRTFEAAAPTQTRQLLVRPTLTYNPETCCALCLEDPACAAFYIYGTRGGQGCALISRSNGVCDEANPLLLRAVTFDTYNPNDVYRAVENNKCGVFVESRVSDD